MKQGKHLSMPLSLSLALMSSMSIHPSQPLCTGQPCCLLSSPGLSYPPLRLLFCLTLTYARNIMHRRVYSTKPWLQNSFSSIFTFVLVIQFLEWSCSLNKPVHCTQFMINLVTMDFFAIRTLQLLAVVASCANT